MKKYKCSECEHIYFFLKINKERKAKTGALEVTQGDSDTSVERLIEPGSRRRPPESDKPTPAVTDGETNNKSKRGGVAPSSIPQNGGMHETTEYPPISFPLRLKAATSSDRPR